jgi:peptidoglycan/LPS O-acetylase OafA/YrhL
VLCSLRGPIVHDYNLGAPLNLNGYWLALPVLRCLPEFTLGLLAFRFARTGAGQRVADNAWIAAATCLAAAVLLALPMSDLAVVLLFPVLVVSLSSSEHLPGRILSSPPAELIGNLSYSIYLTHKLAYGLLGWVYERAHAAGIPHAQTVAAAVCIALTFPLAYVAYRTIEIPGRRRLRAFFEGSPERNPGRPSHTSPVGES